MGKSWVPQLSLERAELLANIFEQLDTVLLCPSDGKAFDLVGKPPPWLTSLCPDLLRRGWRPEDHFPFLESFLDEARMFWRTGQNGSLASGCWNETLPSGQELNLRAKALLAAEQPVLLIFQLGADFEELVQTLQKARENDLAHTRLTRDLQRKETLLHCIVHDLGGPLCGIKGGLSLLKGESLSPKGRRRLENSVEAAARMERLVRDVVDVLSSEVGLLRLSPGGVDAAACVRDVVSMMHSAATAEGIALGIRQEEPERECRVKGDRPHLERVLFNLIENALRVSPEDSEVRISLRSQLGSCRIAVEDQGPGVPAELVPSLFKRFSRSEESGGRAGIGLYFCRIVVEEWGGALGYQAAEDGGARFWIELPLASGDSREEQRRADAPW